MANRLKKKSKPDPNPEKSGGEELQEFRKEKSETVDLKTLARDERTWKITGAVFLLISLFLFTAFASYIFTWKEDQDIAQQGLGGLLEEEQRAANLLGNLGAVVAHYFFVRAFGVASFLICTFFFVVGVNLLFRSRVFSIWRNLKYVTLGLLVLSVSLSFFFAGSGFSWGGGVGNLISNKLTGAVGSLGTAAILLLMAIAYFIWQFNPSFSWPVNAKKSTGPAGPLPAETGTEELPAAGAGKTVNDLYAEEKNNPKANQLKGDRGLAIQFPDDEPLHDLKMVEKEPEEPLAEIQQTPVPPIPAPEKNKEIELSPIITQPVIPNDSGEPDTTRESEKNIPPVRIQKGEELELEIKAAPEKPAEETATTVENLPPYEPTLDLRDYKYPVLNLLETHGSEKIVQDTSDLENHKNQIIATLRNYQIEIQKISATIGPTVTLYEIVPAPGVRISRIKNLEDDIALSLAALGIRIIAPIPGKGTIGIEVPNIRKTVVSMRSLLASEKFQNNNFNLPIAIGKRIDNENFIVDLTTMPHLLMAGATGQGKSVGVNAILVSLLYKKHPSQLKLVLIDPKKVELSIYRRIEKHFLAKLPGEEEAIITDTKKVVNTLNALCIEMDNRYDLLKEAGARNIREYNEKFIKRKLNPQKGHQYLPFIVLVIDEFADLIMTAGKEIEMPIARLAQLARAVGIHLIIATQRPSVNIITGTIKANFPARIGFKVSSKIDSRTILDTGGAEQLIGKGDMLISYNGELTRLQCAFVDTPEVDNVVDYISEQRGYPQAFLLPEYVDEKELDDREFDINDRDSLFEDAARLIVQNQIGSTSLLQRRMKLGYNRAGRLMDQLEAAGIVGPSLGSKARDVLIKTEAELQQHLEGLG